jgi:hypothetical protein
MNRVDHGEARCGGLSQEKWVHIMRRIGRMQDLIQAPWRVEATRASSHAPAPRNAGGRDRSTCRAEASPQEKQLFMFTGLCETLGGYRIASGPRIVDESDERDPPPTARHASTVFVWEDARIFIE